MKQVDQTVNTLDLFPGHTSSILARTPPIVRGFYGFPQFNQANAMVVPQIRQLLFPLTS
jgi:hypothetical protein